METVEWDLDETPAVPEHESFGENQIGSITLEIEPVATGSPSHWVAERLKENPEWFAVAVEKDGGVVGLVTRAKILERAGKFLENLSSRPLDQDLNPHQSLDARESIDKVVSQIFSVHDQPLPEYFVVYLDGQYYGLTDLRRLVARSALLREQDLLKAQDVQEAALAKDRLIPTDWQRARFVRMAYGVGGDCYQELSFGDGSCLLGCFDVSGKGVSGAFVTAALEGFFSALRSLRQDRLEVVSFAQNLNRFLNEILPLGTFVTGVLFILPAQPKAGAAVKILNFGYSPIYFYTRKEKTVSGKAFKPNLPPLGLDDLKVEESHIFSVGLEYGTKLYAFSDGMADLMTPSGMRFGEDQIRDLISKTYKLTASEWIDRVKTEIQSWQANAPQADDITALTIQYDVK